MARGGRAAPAYLSPSGGPHPWGVAGGDPRRLRRRPPAARASGTGEAAGGSLRVRGGRGIAAGGAARGGVRRGGGVAPGRRYAATSPERQRGGTVLPLAHARG